MSLESLLSTANQYIPVIGLGGVGAIGIALWRGGFASGQRKREVDQLILDVKTIKGQINNGGLKEAIGDIQVKCAGEMNELKQKVTDHLNLPGHPGVTEDISALKTKVEMIDKRTGG